MAVMIRVLAVMALAAGIAGSAIAQPVQAVPPAGAPMSFSQLAQRLAPAVVNISTASNVQRPAAEAMPEFPPGSPLEDMFRDFMEREQGPRRANSLGSGFVIDPAGFIVTNNHVITGADEITVTFTDGSTLPATVVGIDEQTDIALLKVEPRQPLAHVGFGNSDTALVGDWVIAIGNPFGLGGSVTAGIISARNRDIEAGPYDDFIQTDAPINRGNSGGPLFNLAGEVVGVNTAIYSPTGGSVGIGFAIPSNFVQTIVGQIKAFGAARRGWIGVRVQSIDETMAEGLGLPSAKGALISEVTPGGPAERAGLKNGDVVVGFDGRTVEDSRAFPRMVAESEVGRTVEIRYLRGGALETAQVTLEKLADETAQAAAAPTGDAPAEQPQTSRFGRLGLSFGPLDQFARERYRVAETVQGVLVTAVDPEGPAAEKNVRVGDVIVEVAQEPVASVEDVIAKVDAYAAAKRRVILLLIRRADQLTYIPVRLPVQN